MLTFGIISNVALLGYFKYADFLIENLSYIPDEGRYINWCRV